MFAVRENTSERTRENPGKYVFLITASQRGRRRWSLAESGLAVRFAAAVVVVVGGGGEEVRRGEQEKNHPTLNTIVRP